MPSKREIQEKLDAGRRRMVRQMYVNWAERDLGMKFAGEEHEDRFVRFVKMMIDHGSMTLHVYVEGKDLGCRIDITEKGKRELEIFKAAMN